MMFGWRSGKQISNIILLDSCFPWPSLHHGREALRVYGETNTKRRLRFQDNGPWRLSWPVQTSVKESGDAVITVWPTDSRAGPRQWWPSDEVWRRELPQLAEFVGADLMCSVKLHWMPGDSPYVKLEDAPTLRDRPGFYGWKKGEKEPNEARRAAEISDAIIRQQIESLALLPRNHLEAIYRAVQERLERQPKGA